MFYQLGHLREWIHFTRQHVCNRVRLRLFSCGLCLHRGFFCLYFFHGASLLFFLRVIIVLTDILSQLVVHLSVLLIVTARGSLFSLKLICFDGFELRRRVIIDFVDFAWRLFAFLSRVDHP